MSKSIEIKVPDIGDYADVPVIEVLVKAGDRIEAEDSLITLESDKATMEVPSPAAGTVTEVRLQVGDTVTEGDVVAVLDAADVSAAEDATQAENRAETEDESAGGKDSEPSEDESGGAEDIGGASADSAESEAGDAGQSAEASEEPEPGEPRVAESPIGPVARVMGAEAVDPATVPYASPAIRKFARELGVDLHKVEGSGSKGRILREDVAGFVKTTMSTKPAAAPSGPMGLEFPQLPEVDYARYGEVERKALSKIRKLSAGHLHRNWVGIPHVTQHDEADITDMEAFRKANAEEAQAQGFKLTPLVFLIKAVVAGLKKFPNFNASLDKDGETLVLKKYFNVGIAVDTEDGLIVPVIRNCERKGIMELARELGEVSEKARKKKLGPKDIQGGCISISSLGGIGGTGFTPIINAPEVAILGVSRSQMKPIWDGEQFNPRLMLPLSLSYDHRVVDGADAARFTRFVASRLEDLRRLTL